MRKSDPSTQRGSGRSVFSAQAAATVMKANAPMPRISKAAGSNIGAGSENPARKRFCVSYGAGRTRVSSLPAQSCALGRVRQNAVAFGGGSFCARYRDRTGAFCLGSKRTATILISQFFFDNFSHHFGVGAGRLLHNLADQELQGRGLSGPVVGERFGMGSEDVLNGGRERVAL